MNEKYRVLLEYLRELKSVVVAFSGGVDSTFLLHACKEALGDNVCAVTIDSPYIPRWEIEESKELAKRIGVRHFIIENSIPDIILDNPKDRCYLCKKDIFKKIKAFSDDNGFNHVVDGSNLDDTKDYRPGMIALGELKIKSPLLENRVTKKEIRELSEEFNLPTWNKPPYACLLSRIPYFTIIKEEELRRIEKSEKYLMDLGFPGIRVRSYGTRAKIEVFPYHMDKFLNVDNINKVYKKLTSFGYDEVTLDLGGYKMGSMNKSILEGLDE